MYYCRHIFQLSFNDSFVHGTRVSFETSFNSKQQKLEPKLVSALSETKRLFRLFRFYTEKESFDVSIEPKQTEDQPKQFKRFGGSCHSFYLFCLLQSHTFIITFVQYTHSSPFAEASLQFDREHILLFFTENLGFSGFFSFFPFFRFVSKQFVSIVSLLYQNWEFRCFD